MLSDEVLSLLKQAGVHVPRGTGLRPFLLFMGNGLGMGRELENLSDEALLDLLRKKLTGRGQSPASRNQARAEARRRLIAQLVAERTTGAPGGAR